MDATGELLKVKARDAAFFSIEAYCMMSGALLPMGQFASELLDAKTEADVKTICEKHGVAYDSFDERTQYRFYRMTSNLENCAATDKEATFTFPAWLLARMKTISSLLELHTICLPIARGATRNSEISDLFHALHYAHRLHQQIIEEIHYTYGWLPDDRNQRGRIRYAELHIPKFPLVSLFGAFQQEDGYGLQSHYGYTFKKVRRRGVLSPPQSRYHYWDNPASWKDARDKLWGYTSKHRTDDDHYILNWQPQALAARYLEIIDRCLESNIGDVSIQFDSLSGTARIITNRGIVSGLSLWLFSQIQGQTDYRVCKMCGKLFIPGSQKGKKYCDLHKKHEINYYNKTIGDLNSTSESGEIE